MRAAPDRGAQSGSRARPCVTVTGTPTSPTLTHPNHTPFLCARSGGAHTSLFGTLSSCRRARGASELTLLLLLVVATADVMVGMMPFFFLPRGAAAVHAPTGRYSRNTPTHPSPFFVVGHRLRLRRSKVRKRLTHSTTAAQSKPKKIRLPASTCSSTQLFLGMTAWRLPQPTRSSPNRSRHTHRAQQCSTSSWEVVRARTHILLGWMGGGWTDWRVGGW